MSEIHTLISENIIVFVKLGHFFKVKICMKNEYCKLFENNLSRDKGQCPKKEVLKPLRFLNCPLYLL